MTADLLPHTDSLKGRIAIVGDNDDGRGLLRLLLREPDVEILGVLPVVPSGSTSSPDSDSPVRRFASTADLCACEPDIVFDAIGQADVAAEIHRLKTAQTAWVGLKGTRFFLSLLAKHFLHEDQLSITSEETRSYLRNVLDNMADSVITTSMNGDIVEFNAGAERIFGFPRGEVTGRHVDALWVNPEERHEVLQRIKKYGFVSNHEARLRGKDGRVLDANVTISYIVNDRGERLGTVGITKDITDRKRMERELASRNEELAALNDHLEEKVIERTQELRRANADLERSNRVKSQFIATMSHELRTPLNSILGFSELLGEERGGPLNEKQKRYVGNIYQSGSHLLQLINNILDLAKIESGKMEMALASFFVPEAIDEVIAVIRSLFDKKQISFSMTVDPGVGYLVADRIKFKQILYNLLSNAAKFTPETGRTTLDVSMLNHPGDPAKPGEDEAPAGMLRITVTDTGIGIREEDQVRIFSEFEQVDSSYARRYEGTGLGLALTKRLVELHGGEISVRSTEGQGSTFKVLLPSSEEPQKAEISYMEEIPGDISLPVEPFGGRSGEMPRVVVVEDDGPTRELMTLYLTEAGYSVSTVGNGEQALSVIRDLQPFAIILDVMLPGKDGWQILQELKSDPDLKDIPVIMATMVENQELGFALGATDYLVKPIDRAVLYNKLDQLSVIIKRHRGPVIVLCIDTHVEVLQLLTEVLEQGGYTVLTADSGRDGIEKAFTYRPDLIILDLLLPDLDGFEVTRRLKENPATSEIPICILTSKNISVEERLDLAGKVDSIMQKTYFTKEDLLLHMRDLEIIYPTRAGLIDKVTGLFDRCYFQLRLAQEVSRANRYKRAFTVVTIDLDDFSPYVERFGIRHANACVRRIADFLKKTLRGSDTIVRYGFDEFTVILADTLPASAIDVAKRFLAFIEGYPFHGVEELPGGKISASIALVSFPHDAGTPEQIMAQSHQLLREAKGRGGGRLACVDA